MNEKEISNFGSAQSHKQLGARADAPALAMMRTCTLKNFVTSEKKNAFTFTATAEVRSTVQTFFII